MSRIMRCGFHCTAYGAGLSCGFWLHCNVFWANFGLAPKHPPPLMALRLRSTGVYGRDCATHGVHVRASMAGSLLFVPRRGEAARR
jgi:hypothetical protein